MPWIAIPIVAVLGLVIGYAVGKMPCWKSWQGYAGLGIVAALVHMIGMNVAEIVVDCTALAAGFFLARKA